MEEKSIPVYDIHVTVSANDTLDSMTDLEREIVAADSIQKAFNTDLTRDIVTIDFQKVNCDAWEGMVSSGVFNYNETFKMTEEEVIKTSSAIEEYLYYGKRIKEIQAKSKGLNLLKQGHLELNNHFYRSKVSATNNANDPNYNTLQSREKINAAYDLLLDYLSSYTVRIEGIRKTVDDALQEMEPFGKEEFRLRYFEGKSWGNIADVTHYSTKQCERRANRAFKNFYLLCVEKNIDSFL